MALIPTAYLSVPAFIAAYSLNSVVLPTVLTDLMRNVYAVPFASPLTVNVSVVLFFVVAITALVLLDMALIPTAYLSVPAFIAVYSLNSVVPPVFLNDFILKE